MVVVCSNFINTSKLGRRQLVLRGLDRLINDRRTFDLLKAVLLENQLTLHVSTACSGREF